MMSPIRALRRRDPVWRIPCALVLAATGIAFGTLRPAAATDPGSPDPLQAIQLFAETFAGQQNTDGSYLVSLSVQAHLKAEIAMALAAEATGRRDFLDSAYRDLRWVIANRLEANGGISWNGPQDNYFFEVHQHWFLIASEMIRRQESNPAVESIKDLQRNVWLYLLRYNAARSDFYEDNEAHHGVFFAYRDIDRQGHFQTQAPFKGSYEIGVALWSMALHRGDRWLISRPGAPADTSLAPSRYLARLVPQTIRPLEEHGFYDSEKGLWIRSVLWNGIDWTDYEPHDFKYVPHMEEGALMYALLTGRTELLAPARLEIEEILSRVHLDGTIRGIPDGYGTPAYEYGTVLSCLGLAAQLWSADPDLSERIRNAASRVLQYTVHTFDPISSEDQAMLLAGFCRIAGTGSAARDLAQDVMAPQSATREDGVTSGVVLLAWPNPMRDRIRFSYTIRADAGGVLRVIDASGRECIARNLAGDRPQGEIVWDGLDDGGRRLPAGAYHVILQAGNTRRIAGFAILP